VNAVQNIQRTAKKYAKLKRYNQDLLPYPKIGVRWSPVTSRNTHVTFADNIRLLPAAATIPVNIMHFEIPGTSLPARLEDIHSTLISTFSLSLVSCTSLTLPTCAPFHVHIALLCFHLHFRYPVSLLSHLRDHDNAMILTPYIRPAFM